MSHAISRQAPRVSPRKLWRWVHRAVVEEIASPVHSSVSDVNADGWLCLRCGERVPEGGDRTPHYRPH